MYDYSKLTTEELIELRTEKERGAITLENKQMAIKILMNSLYGALS